ncbi:MAG: glycoside hydrolase domain-containing protein, partial [bacterium]
VVPVGTVNGEHAPDALPALNDGGLVTIPSNRAAKIWISVDAHNSQPGTYQGRIFITPLYRETEPIELTLNIEVLDLKIPQEFPLTVCTWDYLPNATIPESVVSEALDDIAKHGVNVFPRPGGMPIARVDSNDRLIFDWSPLDVDLKRLDGKGIILFHSTHPPIQFESTPAKEKKRKIEIEYFRAFRDYLKDHGWDYDKYGFYPVDEPGLDHGKRVPGLVEIAELYREADPKFRVYTDPVPFLSWRDFERIEPLIDIWCPNMRLVSAKLSGDPRIERTLKSKGTLWSYECISQVKSLTPLGYNRANSWRAKYFGLKGIGFWNHSSSPADIWFPGKTMNDEYALVYPGGASVPSVRWEALRDGLEDMAAVELLKQRIDTNKQSRTKEELSEQAENAIRIAFIDVMELSNLVFMESRDFLRWGDRRQWHTWTDVEMFQRHRSLIADMTLQLEK